MNKQIEYYTKSNYGRILMYIKNSEKAEVISRLTGKKTIDESDIKTFNFWVALLSRFLKDKVQRANKIIRGRTNNSTFFVVFIYYRI